MASGREKIDRPVMRSIIVFLLAVAAVVSVTPFSHSQAGFQVQIANYEWPQSASVDDILQIPQLRSAIARYDVLDDSILIIRYPGGHEGNAWAESLRNALVSLGIRQSYILLEPGSGVPETIVVIVTESQEY